jgi:L-ascorbate metabolism protein UlaG (beta-lactamase superfamily)
MKLTFYGHSCFMLEAGGSKLLFDPFIRHNRLAAHIPISEIKPDYILISHGHEDHVADAEDIARQSGAMFISNFEVVSWFGKKGFEKLWAMNHGGKHTFDFGTVRYVNAVHSSTMPDGEPGGNPGGFIIEADGKRLYYAGDTAVHMDMELIGRHWRPDIAILPIGDNFTMGVEDAVICSDMIRCDKIIGMHYDTFPFIEIDHKEAVRTFSLKGIKLSLMEIGESKEV